MSEATRELLRFYRKELASRPVVEQWRTEVPTDARRAWLRYMISNAGADKLRQPAFKRIILDRLSPAEVEQVTNLTNLVQELANAADKDPDNDALGEHLLDRSFELDDFYQSHMTDEMLENFARLYFGEFDTNPDHVNEHFERAQRVARLVQEAIVPLLLDAPKTAETMFSQGLLYTYKPNLWAHIKRADLRDQFKAVMLVGSGAVGPRSVDYPKRGDFDLYVIPGRPDTADPVELSMATGILNSLAHVITDVKFKAHPWLANQMPELAQHLSNPESEHADLFLPELADPSPFYKPDDWRKLTGPSVVLSTHGSDWQAALQYYQQAAIQRAQEWLVSSRHY